MSHAVPATNIARETATTLGVNVRTVYTLLLRLSGPYISAQQGGIILLYIQRYRTPISSKKQSTDPDWIYYLREDAFFANFSIAAPGFLVFLQISAWLSCFSVLLVLVGILYVMTKVSKRFAHTAVRTSYRR